jgi:hypothetical protein
MMLRVLSRNPKADEQTPIMEIKPLQQIETPAYPTLDDLLADKTALRESVPCRWRKAHGLAGALSLFLAANSTGCGGTSTPQPPPVTAPATNMVGNDTAPGLPVCPTPAPAVNVNPVVVESEYWIRSIFAEPHSQSATGGVVLPSHINQEDSAVQSVLDSGPNP